MSPKSAEGRQRRFYFCSLNFVEERARNRPKADKRGFNVFKLSFIKMSPKSAEGL
jgi:hypothetical protein